MQKFVIHTKDGADYTVYTRFENGEAIYSVHIDGYMVNFKGRPNWDTVGAFIFPVNPPADLDEKLLEEIATKIDNFNL